MRARFTLGRCARGPPGTGNLGQSDDGLYVSFTLRRWAMLRPYKPDWGWIGKVVIFAIGLTLLLGLCTLCSTCGLLMT